VDSPTSTTSLPDCPRVTTPNRISEPHSLLAKAKVSRAIDYSSGTGSNPGGNREANHALWRIVITRMSSHAPTRAYVERRSAEGLSKKEIIRCLKRYVAREVYRHLRAADG
jgi:hypothetical protein